MIILRSKMSLKELMEEWICMHRMEVSGHTVYNQRKSIKQVVQVAGADMIKDIDGKRIQEIINQFSEKGLLPATIKDYAKVIRMSLKYAEKMGYIKASPYKGIMIPKKQPEEIYPFEEQEVKRLLRVDAPGWFGDACEIAFRTGMRRGEIFALKKEDVNLQEAFVMVKRTQTLDERGKVILGSPKTGKSRRRIDCDKSTMKILNRRILENESEFIFENRDGGMKIPWTLSSNLKNKSEIARIGKHRFHDFRHGHATYLLIHNVHPKIVQERLGHANISVTLDTYSHLVPGLQKLAVEATSEMDI